MASAPFGAFITHHQSLHSSYETPSPPRAVHIIPPNGHELDEIHVHSPIFGVTHEPKPNSQSSLVPTPNELESNGSTVAEIEINSQPHRDVVEVMQSLNRFFLIGFGFALTGTISNVFILNLTNATTLLGVAHGAYGIGGTVGPLIATTLVSNGLRWSVYYFICIGISAFNLFFAGWSFWNFEADTESNRKNGTIASNKAALPANNDVAPETFNHHPNSYRLFRQAMSNRTTLLGSLFIFAYQGAEVSISGWVISFLQAYRISTTSSLSTASIGYVTSGFWAGITLGRFILSHPAQRIGEKRFVFGLTLGALMFQLIVWFVPNVIGDAVAVGFIGLLLGPIYPCAMSVFSRLLNKDIQMVAVGIVSALGCTGGAIAPFSTGLLAQSVGTWVLHPVCVVLFASMMGSWAGLKAETKRRE
ncbi:MAG: hypothetical protein M1829_004791 [Trizodia sp. TS-e1964]|nr:MAG: hypothetical protein M1829_004791 [Trizodia sp. TS-e1964]